MSTPTEQYMQQLDKLRQQLNAVVVNHKIVLFNTGFDVENLSSYALLATRYGEHFATIIHETAGAFKHARGKEMDRLNMAINEHISAGVKEPLLSQGDYLQSGACPRCRDDAGPRTKPDSSLTYLDATNAQQPMDCTECGAEWIDELSVTGYYTEKDVC